MEYAGPDALNGQFALKQLNRTSLSKTEPLNVALIGCGAVSELYHAPALNELEKQHLLRVKALFDPTLDRVAELKRFFPAATPVTDLAQLPSLGLHLAVVASPPRFHAAQSIQLLQAGLSVFCEKPMASSVAEGEAMLEAAVAAPGLLAIGLFRRFFPATQTIRDLLARKVLGEVKTFYCYEGGRFEWPVQSASFFKKEMAQGGVLLDIGVHLLDLLIWWWGQPVEVIYEDDAMGGIEVNCRLTLKFAEGFSGQVRLSRDCTQPNRYVIQAEKGWLSWTVNEAEQIQIGFYETDFALNAQLHENKTEGHLPTLGQPSFNFQQSFVNQFRNVVAAMQGTAPLVVPGEQGLKSLKLIEQCYRHRRLMAMPWLSEAEQQQAHQLSSGTLS
jgi:predicted dehydrogenase